MRLISKPLGDTAISSLIEFFTERLVSKHFRFRCLPYKDNMIKTRYQLMPLSACPLVCASYLYQVSSLLVNYSFQNRNLWWKSFSYWWTKILRLNLMKWILFDFLKNLEAQLQSTLKLLIGIYRIVVLPVQQFGKIQPLCTSCIFTFLYICFLIGYHLSSLNRWYCTCIRQIGKRCMVPLSVVWLY